MNLAIIIFYHPSELKESFWAQILSIYSLLLACAFTTFRHNITRIHAILTVATAGSPLSVYLFCYAIRSLFRGRHRMTAAVGEGRRLARMVVLFAMLMWISLLAYILLPSSISDFGQEDCEQGNEVVLRFYFLPILIFMNSPLWIELLIAFPFFLTALAWLIALWLRRREIWPRQEPWRPNPRRAWYAALSYLG